jgi:hypothetical protein
MRTAHCQCRGFRVVVDAEPDTVAICHCQMCQRRSGVPLTCNAYFQKSKVRLEGDHRIYTRDCPDGRKLNNHFCPTCGSTVAWTLDLRPNQLRSRSDVSTTATFRRPWRRSGKSRFALGRAYLKTSRTTRAPARCKGAVP